MTATSNIDQQQLVTTLQDIVGSEYLSISVFERIESSLDIFPYEKERESLPLAVVMPKDKNEIAAIINYANGKEIPVYVRGSGTSFTGASRYPEPGIVNIEMYINDPLNITKEHLTSDELLTEKIFLGLRSSIGLRKSVLSIKMHKNAQLLCQEKKLSCNDTHFYNHNFFLSDELALYILE